MQLEFNRDPASSLLTARVPNTTTASIQEFNSELQQEMTLGTQLVTLDGQIYSRTYNVIRFNEEDPLYLDRVEVGYESPVYEADHYYRVVRPYYQDTYSSSVANPYDTQSSGGEDFRNWNVVTTNHRAEMHYKPVKVGELVWSRPPDWPRLVDSVDGEGNQVQVIEGGGQLPSTFTLPLINVGRNVAARVVASVPLKVELLQSPSSNGQEVNGTFLLHYTYLRITLLEITLTDPLTVTIEWWGEHLFTTGLPVIQHNTPQEIISHPDGTPISSRRKPPGLSSLREDFWNSSTTAPPINNYWNRSTAGWIN